MARSLAALLCTANRSRTRQYLMLDGWPLTVSILSRTVGGLTFFCSFGCFVDGFSFLASSPHSYSAWSSLQHTFSMGKTKFNPCGASTAKANSAWMMWFDLAHHSFGSAFSTASFDPQSVHVFDGWRFVVSQTIDSMDLFNWGFGCRWTWTWHSRRKYPEQSIQWQFEMAPFATVPWAS